MAAFASAWEVELVDYFRRFVPGIVVNLSRRAYLDSIRLAPSSYGVFYRTIGKIKPDSRLRKAMDAPGRRGLARYLAQQPYDVVVSLYPIPSGAAAQLRSQGKLTSPLITVVTDYTCHPEWIHRGTDAYIVGDEAVADLMLGYDIDPERIHVLGIPVRASFAAASLKAGPVARGPVRRVLVMAGAYGALGGVAELAEALEEAPGEVETTFVCGRSEALYEKVSALVSSWRAQPRVLGFVADVASEMLAADLVISKAGGITVSEALAIGRPLLIYKPIPGQEQRNCEFLQRHGAGVAVRTAGDLNRVLRDLLTHPGKLHLMAVNARRIGRPQAAWEVAQLVVKMAGEAGSQPPA